MKLITVRINNRIDHIVNFDLVGKTPDSYIIENNGGSVKLFGFYLEGKSKENSIIYQTNDGKQDLILNDLVVEDKGLCDGIVCKSMKLSFVDTKINEKDSINNIDAKYWEQNHSYVSFDANANECYHIDVKFCVPNGDKQELSKTFVLNVAPKDRIYDLVLDYGSEASQMLIHRRQNDVTNINDVVPLFELFKYSLDPDGKGRDTDYLQYDADNINFFKSNFFVKKNLPAVADVSPCGDIKANKELKFLCKVGELDQLRKEYITIPNLKVASHGGVVAPNVLIDGVPMSIFEYGNKFIFRSIVNSFFYQALRKINPYRDKEPRYLNLYILMPNVYSQKEVTRNLNYISEDIMKMSKDIEGYDFLKGIEVASVSESDASFLGFISQLPLERKLRLEAGRYLIMDAGKGTLDFSIVDYKYDESKLVYNSVFRSGIIGAGNAITYSFALAVLRDIYCSKWNSDGEKSVEDAIAQFINTKVASSEADESELNILVKNLERYKIMYNAGELKSKEFPIKDLKIDSFEQFSLGALNNCLANFIDMAYMIKETSASYIENMIDCLAYEASIKVKESYSSWNQESKIDYIVFSGRSFQMKALREKVISRLTRINPDICSKLRELPLVEDKQVVSGANYKNLCLFIAHPLSTGKYNGRIVGMPKLLQNSICEKPQSLNVEPAPSTNEALKKKVIEALKKKVIEALKKKKVIEALKKKIGKWLSVAFDVARKVIDNAFPVSQEKKNYGNRLDSRADDLNGELVNGIDITYTSANDRTGISGYDYAIPNGIVPGIPAEIFFNGEDFEIRQGRNTGLFEGVVDLSGQHVFESTFPYCSSEGGIVPFPRKMDSVNKQQTPQIKDDNVVAVTTNPDSSGANDEEFLRQFEK